MRDAVTPAIARLASIAIQERFIVQGTPSEYYVVEDLLEDLHQALHYALGTPEASTHFTDDEIRALSSIRPLLAAPGLSQEVAASRSPAAWLIKSAPHWNALRERCGEVLQTFGFDLRAFEQLECG